MDADSQQSPRTPSDQDSAPRCKGSRSNGKPCNAFRLNEDGYCHAHAKPREEKKKVTDLIEKEVSREDLINQIGSAFDQSLADQGFNLGEQVSVESFKPLDEEEIKMTPPSPPKKTIRVKEKRPPKKEKPKDVFDHIGHPTVEPPKAKTVLPKKKKRPPPIDPEIPRYEDYEEEDPLAPVPQIVLDEEDTDSECSIDEAAAQYNQYIIFNMLKWLFENGVLGQLEKSYPERYRGITKAFQEDQFIQDTWSPALSNLCEDFGIKLYAFKSYHILLGMTIFKIGSYTPPPLE